MRFLNLWAMMQAAEPPPIEVSEILERILQYLSPYTEYLVILLVFWLFARRGGQKQGDFNRQAQEVLDELFKRGEITKNAYEKFRQDISLRPKR
ncbi:MAG: hypothetical protein ACREL7_18485 [Longimicrobiales bacterium]